MGSKRELSVAEKESIIAYISKCKSEAASIIETEATDDEDEDDEFSIEDTFMLDDPEDGPANRMWYKEWLEKD